MSNVDENAIGRLVRDRRLSLGLSQRALAGATGLSLGTVRDLEQGRTRRPYPSTLRLLSRSLDLEFPRTAEAPSGDEGAGGGAARVLILGTMELHVDGAPVRLGSGRLRTLIACLALNIGEVVSRDTLIDLLWRETPAVNAGERVAEYIRKARELLSPKAPATGPIDRVGRGYVLKPDGCDRDADDFLRLCQDGRAALAAGRHSQAVDLMARALRLWRGEVLAEVDAVKDRPEIVMLRRRRSGAVHDIADALVALDRQDEALAYLEAATARDAFDEAMQAHLLLTLARCGRQSEALVRYQRFSHLLSRELGVRPSPELVEAHRRILHQDLGPAPATRAPSLVAPRQLPAISPFFTGRHRELGTVVEHVEHHTTTGQDVGAVPVVAIDGMAGVGKTAFAVRAAHHLAARFPDGQLFVDLHGYSADRLPQDPYQVLEEFLHALGVARSLIPADAQARTSLYRDRLAGTRTLLVLDNVSAVEQIRPLLPGASGSLVLVTSRRRLTSLDDAFPLTLDALPDEEAIRLLGEMAPQRPDGGTHDLVHICGGLPLALRIVGALLRQRQWLTPDEVADRLRRSLAGPDPLSVFDDGDRNLRSVFELSVEALGEREQNMLGALARIPGPDIDAHAAAALADTDVRSAENLLAALVDHSLLVENAPGRFTLHDLIRLYAAGPAADDGATARLLAYFDDAARRAHCVLTQATAAAEPRDRARSWMKREAANLLAVTRLAATVGDHRRVTSLADSCYEFLRVHGPWSDALAVLSAAVDAADERGDPVTGAVARIRLGVIKRLVGDWPGAVADLRDATRRLTRIGDPPELVTALQELGETYRLQGDFTRSEQALRAALALPAPAGDRLGRGRTLTSLGSLALTCDSDPYAAIGLLEEAIDIYRAGAHLEDMINASCYLGDLHRALGNYAQAERILESAMADARGIDDHLVQANVLVRLGYLRHLLAEPAAADATFREALDLYLLRGSRVGEANTLVYIGVSQAARGEHADAVEILRRAYEIYRALGNDRGKAIALMYTAQSTREEGDPAEAATTLATAIDLFHRAGDTINEAYARSIEGSFALADGELDAALVSYGRARELAHRNGRRVLEAAALHRMGKAVAAKGDTAESAALLESALVIYRELNSPAVSAVEEDLNPRSSRLIPRPSKELTEASVGTRQAPPVPHVASAAL
ncbi:tetratricopeptide repeat protein [Krasilnikovia sp. M28-CT-15]|uniref:tetratricopeptide repeat protein n=1 Tax=Krasilnikovia sp. M28-CT-15 TaxID=3373540 RepID=UPI00387682EF